MAKLTLVRKSDPDVPEHLLQEALKRLMEIERAGFAENLDTARGMWRKYRELVEAPDFPEPFRAAYIEEHDGEAPDDPNIGFHGEDALAPDFRERTLPSALEVARAWALRGMGIDDADAKAFAAMGISL